MSDITPKILEKLREKNGWSKTEVARRLGIKTVSTYANWEYGIRTPDKDMLSKIAELYGVTTDYLIDGDENKLSIIKSDETYNSLDEINKLVKQYGIEQMGFFDIEEWKNLSPDDVKLVEEHFKLVVKLAKERNKEK